MWSHFQASWTSDSLGKAREVTGILMVGRNKALETGLGNDEHRTVAIETMALSRSTRAAAGSF